MDLALAVVGCPAARPIGSHSKPFFRLIPKGFQFQFEQLISMIPIQILKFFLFVLIDTIVSFDSQLK
jgi:hypothetical protein